MSDQLGGLEPLRLRSTAEIVADKIRESILSGHFSAGERIAEVPLCERLGISRGPLREALQRLVQEGLLINTQNKGVCVVDLQQEDLADIYLARRAIEREALVQIFPKGFPRLAHTLEGIVLEMHEEIESRGGRRFPELDMKFHTEIVSAAQSKRLSKVYSTLSAEFQLCITKILSVLPVGIHLVNEHRRFVALIREGNLDCVLAELDEHLDRGIRRHQSSLEIMDETG